MDGLFDAGRVIVLDEHGVITDDQAGLAAVLGRDAAVGQRFVDLVAPAQRSRAVRLLAAAGEFETKAVIELAEADGAAVPVQIVAAPMNRGAQSCLRLVLGAPDGLVPRRPPATMLLGEGEPHWRLLATATLEGIAITRQGCLIDCNERLQQMLGYAREELIGKPVVDLVPADDRERVLENIRTGGKSWVEHDMIGKDGRRIQIQACGQTLDGAEPRIRITALRDITAHKQAEQELRHINRTLQAFSASGWALVHATDETSYLHEVCRIVVEDCGHAMAWVGMAEHDVQQSVRPVAHAGSEAGYLDTLQLTWADRERGRGPTGTAIRTGQPVICRAMDRDPAFQPWRNEARQRGYAASVALPMKVDGQIIGALMIYSWQPDPFIVSEVALLQKLADELAYGLGVLRLRAERASQAVALRASEARFRLLASATFEGIAITEQGRVVDTNEQLPQMLGLTRADMVGQPVAAFIPHAQRQRVLDNIQRGCQSHVEHDLICQDGRHIQVEARGLTLGEDEPARVRITALRDITERKRAEDQIRRQQRQLHSFIQHAPISIAMFDRDMRYLAYSQRWLSEYGRGRADLIGCHHYAVHPDISEAWKAVHRRGMTGETVRNDEDHWRQSDGSDHWLRWAVVPWHDELGEIGGILISAEDITAIKRIQDELVRANENLAERTFLAEEASAAKSRFLSSISHELRTPLHTILGYVRQLLKNSAGTAHRHLAIVEHSAVHLLKLIDDLLEFNINARQAQILLPAVLPLEKFVGHLEGISHVLAETGHNRFEVALAAPLPAAVVADEQRLLQVLQNLLGNAFKYTRNGTVTLRVAADERRDLALASGRVRLRFAVEDTGAGIAPQDLARIFEPFDRGTLAPEQPGLGLGLAIARQWVVAMGGELQVDSRPGHGSRFHFALDLPSADLSGVSETACTVCDVCAPFRHGEAIVSRTLLVVDDLAENRLLLRDLCELWGADVLEAADGARALALCQRAVPRIDAVLVDQCMPGMDGWELLRRLRRAPQLAQLPVVLISATAPQRPANFPAELSFDLMLGKPFDDAQLKCFLCRHLSRAVPVVPRRGPVRPVRPPRERAETPVPAELSDADRATFRELLHLGRLFRIERWAEGLAARDKRCQAFAAQVVRHCQAADLTALEQLAGVAPRQA